MVTKQLSVKGEQHYLAVKDSGLHWQEHFWLLQEYWYWTILPALLIVKLKIKSKKPSSEQQREGPHSS